MEFRIEKSGLSDISDVIRIIMEVYHAMPEEQKQWLSVDDEDYTREFLTNGTGRAYKAIETQTGTLAAIFIVVIPGLAEYNLGYDIGLSKDELQRVAHMDTSAVLPAYRGFGLQNRMISYAEEELREEGYQILCCTAHPENRFSCDNIRKNGYQVMLTKEKYGGLIRHIFMKRI